jgi:hypothetical protein
MYKISDVKPCCKSYEIDHAEHSNDRHDDPTFAASLRDSFAEGIIGRRAQFSALTKGKNWETWLAVLWNDKRS